MANVQHEIRAIQPSEALKLLAMRRSSAPIRASQVKLYGSEMRSGKWVLNGDPIIIGRSGALLSGVLRLSACVQANAPFPALIIRDIEDGTFETIDSVRRRTVSDILSIRKEESGRILASALSVLWRYATGDYVKVSKSPSAQTVLSILAEHPDMRASVSLTRNMGGTFPHGVAAALHYLFSMVDADTAQLFFDDYRDESPSIPAVAALKRQLTSLAEKGGAKRQPFIMGLAIKAWEAARKGGDVKLLRFNLDEDEAPLITGVEAAGLEAGVSGKSTSDPIAVANAASHNITVEFVEITSDTASAMLNCNTANRKVATYVVDKYARDMKSGDWAVNGQTIKFGGSGRLLDGQHRLHACIKSGRSFNAIVVRGLDEEVFETFDLGARRSLSDILIDRNEINTSTLAAVLRQAWLLERGMLASQMAAPTVAELLRVLDENPNIRESVRLVHKIKHVTAPSLVLALHHEFAKRDSGKALFFIERLGDGAEMQVKHPILRLREQLTRARAERKFQQSEPERAAWIIKAWNAFIEKRMIDHIKWQQSGLRAEAFPIIRAPAVLSLVG